jgi:chromosome segregation ATPase
MNQLEVENAELRAQLKCQVGALSQINSQLEAKIEDLTVSRDLFRYLNEQGIQTNEKVVQRFEDEHKLRIEAESKLRHLIPHVNAVTHERDELSSEKELHVRAVHELQDQNLQLKDKLNHSTEVIDRYLKEIETLKAKCNPIHATVAKVLHEMNEETRLNAGNVIRWEYQVMSDRIKELEETVEYYRTKI